MVKKSLFHERALPTVSSMYLLAVDTGHQ